MLNLNKSNDNKKTEGFLKVSIVALVAMAAFLVNYLWGEGGNIFQQADLLDNSLISRFDDSENAETKSALLKLTKLNSEEAAYAVFSPDEDRVFYYVPFTGELRSVALDGSSPARTIATVEKSAEKVSWSRNMKEVFITKDGVTRYIDLTSGISKMFDGNIISPAFSHYDDNRTAYLYFDRNTGLGNISIGDSKLESYKNIMPTRSNDWRIDWLDKDKLLLTKPYPSILGTLGVYSLDIESGKLEPIIDFRENLEFKISPTLMRVVYSHTRKDKKYVYLADLNSGNRKMLETNIDVSSCVWSNKALILYCVDNTGEGSVFYKLDTEVAKMAPQEIFKSNDKIDASGLMLSSGEDRIIFKDLNNNRLYSLQLN